MVTHERELTEPVQVCTPRGRLDPAARGWSRRPLQTVTLRGWGRNKRWDWWGVLTDDVAVAVTYADVDFLGIADIWWVDLVTGETGGRSAATPLGRGVALPDRAGTRPLHFRGRNLRLELADTIAGTSVADTSAAPEDLSVPAATELSAEWIDPDGSPGRLRATVQRPVGHESLNVVIPWSERTFQYTSKHQARPTHGTLEVRGRIIELDPAWGVLDVGRGRWPFRTHWNWASGAGRSDEGPVVGLQLGGRWTEGTGFTENGVIVDGRLHKIGDELSWSYDLAHPLEPWKVTAPDGSLELELVGRHLKHTKAGAGPLGMEVHQVFGRWRGTVRSDDGTVLHLGGDGEGPVGFAEEARARW